jgi:hypothetical protein
MKRSRHVVALLGGLGNQLFQTAFACHLAKTGRPVWLDVSSTSGRRVDDALMGILDATPLTELRSTRLYPGYAGRLPAIGTLMRRVAGPSEVRTDFTPYGPEIGEAQIMTPAWWAGYWQRHLYAQPLAAALAGLPNEATVSGVTLGIHVRRGDMTGKDTETDTRWFARAVSAWQERNPYSLAQATVWSDDPAWCESNLRLPVPFSIASDRGSFDALHSMATAETLIISRSTLSYWAAMVGTSRRPDMAVIYPRPWYPSTPSWDQVTVPVGWRGVR